MTRSINLLHCTTENLVEDLCLPCLLCAAEWMVSTLTQTHLPVDWWQKILISLVSSYEVQMPLSTCDLCPWVNSPQAVISNYSTHWEKGKVEQFVLEQLCLFLVSITIPGRIPSQRLWGLQGKHWRASALWSNQIAGVWVWISAVSLPLVKLSLDCKMCVSELVYQFWKEWIFTADSQSYLTYCPSPFSEVTQYAPPDLPSLSKQKVVLAAVVPCIVHFPDGAFPHFGKEYSRLIILMTCSCLWAL